MTPYFTDGDVTLFRGDCLDVLPTFESDSVDVVVTSPPYNMGLVPGGNGRGMYRPGAGAKAGRFRDGYGDGEHSDAMPYEAYCAWQRAVLAECWRVARLGVLYNHRPRVEHGRLRLPLDLDFGELPLRQIVVWDRGTGIDVNVRHFCTRQEWLLLFAKPEFKLVDHSASGMGDVWRMPPARGSDHPAPFPVGLPARFIQATGARSVLDPFCGSGTTLVAAREAGITGFGIEVSERYCASTAARLAQQVLA